MIEYQKQLKPSDSKQLHSMIQNNKSFEGIFSKLKNSEYFNEIRLADTEAGLAIVVSPKPYFQMK